MRRANVEYNRCTYICDFSRSVGAGSATTRNTRGLTRSVIALITPPFPAPSRPSNRMQIFFCFALHPFLQFDEFNVKLSELTLIVFKRQFFVEIFCLAAARPCILVHHTFLH